MSNITEKKSYEFAVRIVRLYKHLNDTKKEYEWLINNSYKYGYILRYPKDKEHITGYMFEDRHFRYFGESIATELYESNF